MKYAVILLCLGVALIACGKDKDGKQSHKPVDLSLKEGPSQADALQLFTASIDAYNGQDLAALIGMFAPTVEWIHRTASAKVVRGRAATARQLMAERSAFPDCSVKLERLFVRGNNLVAQGTFQGTQRGAIHGIQPAGKKVVYDFVYFVTVANGKIERNISYFNPATPMRQIGAITVKEPRYPESNNTKVQIVRDKTNSKSEDRVKKFYELWKEGTFDQTGTIVGDEIRLNNRSTIDSLTGIEPVREYMKDESRKFEGLTWDVRGMASFGSYVAVQVVKRGTLGMKIQSAKAPIKKELEIDMTHIFKVDESGKIVQLDAYFDELQAFQQFGYSIPATIRVLSEKIVPGVDGGPATATKASADAKASGFGGK